MVVSRRNRPPSPTRRGRARSPDPSATPHERERRVAEIKAQVAAGTYRVNIDALAETLLRDIISLDESDAKPR